MGAQLSDMTAVSIVNSRTVRIHLAHRSRVFLNALATVGNAAILDQQAVQGNASYFTLPKDTSGPWQLVQYTHDDNLTMTANKYYWNTGYPKIKTINYTFSEDPTSAAAAVQAGTEDMYYPIDPQDAIRLAKAGVTKTYVSDQPGTVEWGLDKSKPPFNNLDVRLAVAYMAPRADKFKVCWDNIGANSEGNIIFPGNWAYTPGIDMFDISQKAALAKASKLMDEAGWKMGSNGVRAADNVPGVRNGTPFKVTVPYENDWTQAACNTLLLQSDEAPLGVAITPQAYDAATFYTKVAQNAFEMFHAGDGWSSVDQELEQGFTCNGQADNIIAKWCNKHVDQLINEAGETSNLATAAELYHQVQLIVEQQEPVIVTGVQYGITSATTKLHGFYARPDNSNRALIYSTLSS
jgi:peptide/nickel transport system substrate-binding protein